MSAVCTNRNAHPDPVAATHRLVTSRQRPGVWDIYAATSTPDGAWPQPEWCLACACSIAHARMTVWRHAAEAKGGYDHAPR